MMNLLRAEGMRTLARRLTWVALVITMLASCLALWTMWEAARPVSEADKAANVAMYENAMRDWEAHKTEMCAGNEECLKQTRPQLEQYGRQPVPASVVVSSMAAAGGYFGFFLAMIVAASLMAAEFMTGSLSNYLTFVPNRLKVFASKFAATVVTSLALGAVVMAFLVGGGVALSVLAGATLTGETGISEGLRMGARGLALPVIGGLLGMLLATILRHTAAAIGVVLGYSFFSGIFTGAIMTLKLDWVVLLLPESNLAAIINGRYVWYSWLMGQDEVQRQVIVHWTWATAYWVVLLGLLTVVAAWLFKRRDVS